MKNNRERYGRKEERERQRQRQTERSDFWAGNLPNSVPLVAELPSLNFSEIFNFP